MDKKVDVSVELMASSSSSCCAARNNKGCRMKGKLLITVAVNLAVGGTVDGDVAIAGPFCHDAGATTVSWGLRKTRRCKGLSRGEKTTVMVHVGGGGSREWQ